MRWGMERPRNHDSRDGVLKNELFLVVGFEHDRVFIEALNLAGKFHAAHQIDSEESLIFPSVV